jgi:hypothetical protein
MKKRFHPLSLIVVVALVATMLFPLGAYAYDPVETHSTDPPQQPVAYNLTVYGGQGATGSGQYTLGYSIPIKAGEAPYGKQFKNWTMTGSEGFFGDANSPNTTFTLPEGSNPVLTIVTANWEDWPEPRYALTVLGGFNSAGQGLYTAGEVVNINAGWAENSIFEYWSTSGGGTFGDVNSVATTFTMPAEPVTAHWVRGMWTETGPVPIPTPPPAVSAPPPPAAAPVDTSKSTTVAVPKAPTGVELKPGKGSLKITFKVGAAGNYQVQYRYKNGSKWTSWKSKTVKVNSKAKTATVTLKKLKSKKTYQVRVYAQKGVKKSSPTGIKQAKVK